MNHSASADKCPACGAAIPEGAPQGLCPKCLLAGVAQAQKIPNTDPVSHAPPAIEEVAAAFPQLEVLELIGQGGMGSVYKARQPKLERFVALKLLPRQLAGDAAFRDRFSREAWVLAKLNHPNIVTVFDFGEAAGFFYLLMEYVDGANLRQAMQAGHFTPEQALAIVPKICEALQFAHTEGILHRDIKPENILLDTKGRLKIADFGIAKLVGEPHPVTRLTATGAAIGTPQYMAPEQLEHPERVDQRADIYSLGVVFYEMLTGELPLGRFAPPSQKVQVDVRLDEVVLKTLEKEPRRRYQHASEVKTDVESVATKAPDPAGAAKSNLQPRPPGEGSLPATAGWQGVWTGFRSRTRLIIKVAIVLVAMVLTYAFVYYHVNYVQVGQYLVRTSNVGWGTPWLSFWRSPFRYPALEYGFDFFTVSFAAGVFAIALGVLLARLRAAERRGTGPHGTVRLQAEANGKAGLRWSGKAIGSAVLGAPNWLAGASLLVFGLVVAVMAATNKYATFNPDLGPRELLVLLGLAVPGLIAMILGAMALGEIRTAPNRLRGAWLAAFGIGGLPVMLFEIAACALVALLMSLLSPGPQYLVVAIACSVGPLAGLAAGLALAWMVHRRATRRPAPPPMTLGGQRPAWGVVLAVFAGVLVVLGIGGLALLPWIVVTEADRQNTGASQSSELHSAPAMTPSRTVSVEAEAPPHETFIVTGVVLSNGVPVAMGRPLRARLWPPSTRRRSPYLIRWQALESSAGTDAPWEIVVEDKTSETIATRLRPAKLPRLEWTASPAAEKVDKRAVTHEAFTFEVARALENGVGGNAHATDWSLRLRLQSSPDPSRSKRGIIADFTLPAHQVAVFELVTRTNGLLVPVPNFATYVVNQNPEPYSGTFLLASDPDDLDDRTALPRWKFGTVGPDGEHTLNGSAMPPLPPAFNLIWSGGHFALQPDQDVIEAGTLDSGMQPAYGLRIRTRTVPGNASSRGYATGYGTNVLSKSRQQAPR